MLLNRLHFLLVLRKNRFNLSFSEPLKAGVLGGVAVLVVVVIAAIAVALLMNRRQEGKEKEIKKGL